MKTEMTETRILKMDETERVKLIQVINVRMTLPQPSSLHVVKSVETAGTME
jgi:hypothetical protein